MMLRRASPSGILPNIETSSYRSREFPDTSCSSVADGSRQTGGPLLLRNGVAIPRSATDSRFFLSTLSLVKVAPKVHHLHLQKQENDLDEQEVYRHHLHQVLVRELDMLIFAQSTSYMSFWVRRPLTRF